MRLSLTNVLFYFITFTVLPIDLYAQEASLKLDSVVIIQSNLPMSLMPSRSWEYEGHDTLVISRTANQMVKVRYCAFTLTNSNSNWASNADFGYSHEIYDLRISTDYFNLLDGISYRSSKSKALDSNNEEISSRSTTISAFPNVFLRTNETIFIDFVQEFYGGTRRVDYRIELIYYSNE